MSYLSNASLYHAGYAIADFENAELDAYEAEQEAAHEELFEKAEFVAVVLNDFNVNKYNCEYNLWEINSTGFHNVDFSQLKFIEDVEYLEGINTIYFESSLNREELIQQLSLAIVLSCDASNNSDKDLSDLPIPF